MIERCPTGIPGLDELLEGGFPRGRCILISGSCGTGKTTFGVQFLYNGIVQYGEPGVLVCLEQDPKELKQEMLCYGFDLEKVEQEGKLVIIDASLSRLGLKPRRRETMPFEATHITQLSGSMSLLPDEFNIETLLEIITSKAKRIGARRAVIDSLPALDFLIGNSGYSMRDVIRQTLISMIYRLKLEGLTTLLITEVEEGGDKISAHGVESYIADGVIVLYYSTFGPTVGRNLTIRKMRGTKHSEDVHPIRFERSVGIRVFKAEETFKL